MRGIEKLIPEAQKAVTQFKDVCLANGLNVLITDTLRTQAEQDALYAQGRTTSGSIVTNCKYPRSLHNWGVAWDFCRNEKGREYDDSDLFFEKVGAIAESLGLVWGGHFKNIDRPHIQLAQYAPDKTAAYLISNYGTPELFMEEKRAEAEHKDKIDTQALLNTITPEIAVEIVNRAFTAMKDLPPKSKEEADAIQWAVYKGIFRGDASGNTMPQKPLLRGEYAITLKRQDEMK